MRPILNVSATTKDLSTNGIAVLLPKGTRLKMKELACISLAEGMAMLVTPRHVRFHHRGETEDATEIRKRVAKGTAN